MSEATHTADESIVSSARFAELEAALAAERGRGAEWALKYDRLLGAYQALQQQLELIKRRLYVAKAERIDTAQLMLEFAATLSALDALSGLLDGDDGDDGDDSEKKGGKAGGKRWRPRGRRNLLECDLPEERIELTDPELEGKSLRMSAEEESCKVKWRRGGLVKLVISRVKYLDKDDPPATDAAADSSSLDTVAASAADSSAMQGSASNARAGDAPSGDAPTDDAATATAVANAPAVDAHGGDAPAANAPVAHAAGTGQAVGPASLVAAPVAVAGAAVAAATRPALTPRTYRIVTAPMPPELLPRSMATPSLLAHIASDKFCDGLPLYRQEDRFDRLGFRIDRGTMCRWLEDVGMALGATIVHAMHADAMRNAFCIATDATGFLIQPIRTGDKRRVPCRKAHYFVQIADADHVFFEYTPKETSAAVGDMFRGFSGYIQADAKSVYDALFRPPDRSLSSSDELEINAERHEVGCWSHARRPLWETAVITKDNVAREALARITRIFALEQTWQGKPIAHITSMRALHLRPHLDAYFEFVAVQYERVKNQRGMLRSALGYSHRQRDALTRFLADGRLELTNNHSERQLRRVATGRKAWLFMGSDDHAQAAGNHMTLIASARLHRLDPEEYLRDVIRVVPHWPRDRFLELCPRDWLATRARLDPVQLEAELGPLTIPAPAPPSEQPVTR